MSNNQKVCVVGSGVTGVSAAKALLGKNIKVLMIDAGLSCPDDIQTKVQSITEVPAWRWTDAQKAVLQKGVESSSTGVKEKLQFGSNYSSKEIDSYPIRKKNTKFYVSYAEGGLSNIWGGRLITDGTTGYGWMANWVRRSCASLSRGSQVHASCRSARCT